MNIIFKFIIVYYLKSSLFYKKVSKTLFFFAFFKNHIIKDIQFIINNIFFCITIFLLLSLTFVKTYISKIKIEMTKIFLLKKRNKVLRKIKLKIDKSEKILT